MRDLIKDGHTTEIEREKSLTPSGMELRLTGHDASAQQLAPPPLPQKSECSSSAIR